MNDDIRAVLDCWNANARKHTVRVVDAALEKRIGEAVKRFGVSEVVRGIVYYCDECKRPGSWQATNRKYSTLLYLLSQTGRKLGIAHWINTSYEDPRAHAERKARTALPEFAGVVKEAPPDPLWLWRQTQRSEEVKLWLERADAWLAEHHPGQRFPGAVRWSTAQRLFIEAHEKGRANGTDVQRQPSDLSPGTGEPGMG